MDISLLAEHAEEAASFLKSFSNHSRLMILCALIDKELSVSELNTLVPLSQSALSQHLSALRHAGLVMTRRESQVIFYQIKNPHVYSQIKLLKDIFCPD